MSVSSAEFIASAFIITQDNKSLCFSVGYWPWDVDFSRMSEAAEGFNW